MQSDSNILQVKNLSLGNRLGVRAIQIKRLGEGHQKIPEQERVFLQTTKRGSDNKIAEQGLPLGSRGRRVSHEMVSKRWDQKLTINPDTYR